MIQPNCSELVVELANITEIEDIKKALRKVEEVTKQKVCIEFFDSRTMHSAFIPIDVSYLFVRDDELFYNWQADPLVWREAKKRGASELAILLGKCKDFPYHSIVLASVERYYKDKNNSIRHLKIKVDGMGYNASPGVLKLGAEQHCVTGNFKPIAEIATAFKHSIYSLDGGRTADFEEWLGTKEGKEFQGKVNI